MQKNITQIALQIGGQQGEGIETAGDILSSVFNRMGYYLYGYRLFSSRIKGGHTAYSLRIGVSPLGAVANKIDVLLALDQESIDLNSGMMTDGGVILADAHLKPSLPENIQTELIIIPFTEMAQQLGTAIVKNMIALGAVGALLGLDIQSLAETVKDVFKHKKPETIELSLKALEAGVNFMADHDLQRRQEKFLLPAANANKHMFMMGNDAIALGALAAGARFMAAYPITPASEIMEYLVQKLPNWGGTVIQTEDEIAACTMTIGANYAGARAFTASAGPGLSLMAEAIGLASMTETPLVIVDAQRGGPSTGLPTRHEQSDILAMVHGTHGDAPKIVLAPSTVEEAFYDMAEAFNLAEEYQCPVILLSDLQLSLGKQTVNALNYGQIEIRRGALQTEPLPVLTRPHYFKRYAVTESGISPRVLPGMKDGLHLVTGLEHDEYGKPLESPAQRKIQMDKRLHKLNDVAAKFNMPVYKRQEHAKADLLLIGIGSTRGVIEEVIPWLEKDGLKVNHAHIRLLYPFPTEELALLIQAADKIAVIEHNLTGQLANFLKMYVADAHKAVNILKYDGTPFMPSEVYAACKEVF